MGGSFKNFTDMIDGGGAGATGATFKGGLLSDALNAMGVRPYGYMDRLGSVRPQMRPAGLMDTTRPQSRPAEPNYADRFAPQRAPLGEMEALDEGSMGTDASGTPSFRDRMQAFAEDNAGDPEYGPARDLGARAYRPEAQPFQLDPINVYRSPMQAEQDFGAAPGGRTDIGSRFLYETQRAGVAPSMDLFQKFMQTGSIR